MVSVEAPARPQSLGTCPSEQQHGTLCQAVFSTLLSLSHSHSLPSLAHFSPVSMEIKRLNCHLPHLLQQRIVLKSAFGLCECLGEGSARSRSRVCAFPSAAATVRTKLAQCITRPTGRHADGECVCVSWRNRVVYGRTRHLQASSEL